MRTTQFTKYTLLLAALMLTFSCARNPVTGKRQLSLMSTKQEVALGLQSDPQVVQEFGIYPDEKLQKYITEKGKAMAAVSHRKDLPWTFRLVNSDVVNAFALPGGYVYFTRGIMAHFNNEAQFAGVLGHEIGHVTARHGAIQYTKGMLAQIGLIAGMIASPEFAQFSDIASQGVQLLLLKNGRDDESQSDKLGVEYSSKIGYDAVEMAGFFKTLKRITHEATGGQEIPTFLSTHPDPTDRFNKVTKNAQTYQRKHKATYDVGRERYLRMIDGIIYGEDPKQGFVEGDYFYHPELKFQLRIPNGWLHQNSPTQFQMVSKDQKAMTVLTLSAQKDLDSAVKETMQQLSLKAIRDRKTTINGLNAYMVLSDQVQQTQNGQQQGNNIKRGQGGQNQGQTNNGQTNSGQSQGTGTGIRVLSTFIEYEGKIYILHGVSKQNTFQGYENSFRLTMESFKKLTDQEKINRQPEVVRIKEVPANKTFAEVMKGFGITNDRMEELAILNGMEQKDVLKAGSLVKVVVREAQN